MAVTRIKVENFKSFNTLDLELGRFNVLIGANASGKSNFTQIFKFLTDIETHGLDNAVSLQGGVEYLRNITLGATTPLVLQIFYDDVYASSPVLVREKRLGRLRVQQTIYRFSIRFTKTRLSFEISEDQLIQSGDFLPGVYRPKSEGPVKGEITHSIVNGKLKQEAKLFVDSSIDFGDVLPSLSFGGGRFRTERWDRKALLLEHFPHQMPNIGIYDFEPKLPKKATPITGKAKLEEDGSNLAIIVKRIISNPSARRQFANLLKDLLPFVSSVNIEKSADRSLIFKLKEMYFTKRDLPASSISDGTINIAALILALYFEHRSVTIIEEPERNIHPSLISKVVLMMKAASEDTQVITTTQNAELVKYAGIENLFFVSRDKDGFSKVFKPGERAEVKAFLQNEIGIEELYVQNLLGARG